MLKRPELKQLPVESLQRGVFQPRREFDQEALQELADSIESAGLIQPIVVRPIKAGSNQAQYEIVAGERRWRAAQLAGLDTVPCLVNHYSDEQTAAVSTIENISRVDLNPIEEAMAYQRLTDEFGYVHEEIAAVVGKSRAKITNSLRLLRLEPSIQQLLIDGELSEGHGKVIAGLPSAMQKSLARKAIVKGWSVRKMEQEAKRAQTQGDNFANGKDPDIKRLEVALADHIGCKVKIDYEDTKGQLKIDFHNLDILEGVFKKLGFKNNIQPSKKVT